MAHCIGLPTHRQKLTRGENASSRDHLPGKISYRQCSPQDFEKNLVFHRQGHQMLRTHNNRPTPRIRITLQLTLYESRKAGGKPSTWLPPGGLVER